MNVYLLSFMMLLFSCKAVETLNPMSALTESGSSDEDQKQAPSDITTQYAALLNNHRISLGLQPLIFEEDLSTIAATHSSQMASGAVGFGHAGFSERCSRAKDAMGGGSLCGEIVATGQKSAEAVISAWLTSSGHRAKIEEPRYTHTGFGFVKKESGSSYWTQIFLEVK